MNQRLVRPRVITNMVGAALFPKAPQKKFSFNGTNQYATFPAWAANGKPRSYVFNFNADAVGTGIEQCIISGIEGGRAIEFYLHATLPTLVIRYRSSAGTQALETVTGIDIAAGTDYRIDVINLGPGSEVYVNGVLVDIEAFAPSDGIQPPLTHIGAGHEAARFFGGTLWQDRLNDDSPINNTTALMGNGARYIEIPEFTVPALSDFEISFDWIRQDRTGTSQTYIIGEAGAQTAGVTVYDSTSPLTPSQFSIRHNSNFVRVFPSAFADVALGQHCRVRYVEGVAGANTGELFIDGVSKGTVSGVPITSGFSVGNIGAIGGGLQYSANSALQNVILSNLTTGEAIGYKVNEGSGLDVIAYDIVNGEFGAAIGDSNNLVRNGTFDSDLSQWDGGSLFVWDNGAALATAGSASRFLFQTGALQIRQGRTYTVQWDQDCRAATVNNTKIGVWNSGIDYPENVYINGSGAKSVTWVATIDGTLAIFNFSGDVAYDNITMIESSPSGTITPDADWEVQPNNTRTYAIRDGSGATIKCIDGNGVLQPTLDATIQNYTDNWE